MTDIVQFINDRLAEDEADAWAVHDISRCDALLYEESMRDAAYRDPDCDCGRPARALREVAAKRALIEYALQAAAVRDAEYGCCHGREDIRAGRCPEERPDGLFILLTLANLWSDHPEFNPAWRTE